MPDPSTRTTTRPARLERRHFGWDSWNESALRTGGPVTVTVTAR